MFLVWVKQFTFFLRVHACKSRIHIYKFTFLRWAAFVFENCVLLGYYAASSGNFLPTFRDNISIPPSRVMNPSFGFLTLKKGPIRCPETLVRNFHYSLRNNQEQRSSLPLPGGSLKTRLAFVFAHILLHWLTCRAQSCTDTRTDIMIHFCESPYHNSKRRSIQM